MMSVFNNSKKGEGLGGGDFEKIYYLGVSAEGRERMSGG